jgi:hypothetical protein
MGKAKPTFVHLATPVRRNFIPIWLT